MTDPAAANFLHPDPARIIVPRTDGDILIEPPMPALLDSPPVFPNAPEFSLLGIPRWVVAETARGELLEAINQHAAALNLPPLPRSMEEVPWIITGHQLEFYHAGVWAKVVVADHIARQKKGLAIDLLVDHDIITELGFSVPAQSAHSNLWSRTAVTWDATPNLTADALRSPTIEQFEHWDSELGDLPATHVDSLAHILTSLRPKDQGADEPYSLWMSRARQKLEAVLGLSVAHVPTSLLCSGTTFFLFALAWIRNAPLWTEVYNRRLAAYRAAAGIKSPMHPMPDLARTQTAEGCWEIELPFWLYTPGEPRARPILRITHATIQLLHNDTTIDLPKINDPSVWDSVQALKRTLRSYSLLLRPRALTLTMYTRLFLADLFIHGIGGALYDQITDALMQELFQVQAPYACVSAAWLLPLPRPADDQTTLPDLLHERHHLLHNPQRGIDPFTSLRTEIAEPLRDRRQLIEQITASLRESRNDADRQNRHAARLQRAELFMRLHATNALLHQKVPKILTRLDQSIAAARAQQEQDKILNWREYYFALHATPSLQCLIQNVASANAASANAASANAASANVASASRR